jgi:mRNA interferase MazF
VKRGEVWTQAGGSGYARKPRPVVIVQSDLLEGTDSIVICLFTSLEGARLNARLPFEPTVDNGLLESSELMADKIMTVPRSKLGRRIGALSGEEMGEVQQALAFVLGFAL